MEKSAKQAHLLSTCLKFANKTFKLLIQKHETKNVVCSKYFFDIWVTLDIPNKKEESKEFNLMSVCNYFLSNKTLSTYEYNILEELNCLTDNEKDKIKMKYAELLRHENPYTPQFEDHCKKHLYTIVNLIHFYKDKYKYLFITFTLDYSQDVGLVHQCALLIDLKEYKFIFYEPYGTYIKYDHDYSEPIKKYLDIYDEYLFGLFGKHFTYTTFHQEFVSDFQNIGGIQNIILTSNNSKEEEVNTRIDKLLDEIKRTIPSLHDLIISDISSETNPVNTTDKTMKVIYILEQFELYHSGIDDQKEFERMWMEALEIYAIYNSKTCVSITLVEMDALFSNADFKTIYNSYINSPYPSKILMKNITDLLDELYKNKLVINTMDKDKNICRNFK